MNSSIVEKTAAYFRGKGVILPTIAELKNPNLISEEIKNKVMRKYMELYEIITGENTNFYENKFFRPILRKRCFPCKFN